MLEMKFEPKTIEHLGVRMYSTLPPALAELISNAYDADASIVKLKFSERNGSPVSINVVDDGHGMSSDDIQNKFLVIGRNRREDIGDVPTLRFNRLATGKKGLGKLALFGLAKEISVDTVKDGKRNRFVLNWDELMSAAGKYNPRIELLDEPVSSPNGTTIKLSELKRQSLFDIEGLADSLSKIFIVDENFTISLSANGRESIKVSNERRYSSLNKEFEWDVSYFLSDTSGFNGVSGKLYTAETPIKPNSGLRGVSIFSRGKLVNAPEFFSNSTSSHFFQYLTGWIQADFIDLLKEDVISTNRQAINWDNEEMTQFRARLSEMISKVNTDWRDLRRKKKGDELRVRTGIDTEKWMATMPDDVKGETSKILEALSGEDALERFTPVIEALHKIVPEYPQLHWRYLNDGLRDRIKPYYENQQFGHAASQGVNIYCEALRKVSGSTEDGTKLVGSVFGGQSPLIRVADIATESGYNIQIGQNSMSRGVIEGFRNPISHAPMDSVVPNVFSELDCLNVLSLLSYLLGRVDKAL